MHLTDRLSLAQRIVAVVALGWFAYAPVRRTANYPLGGQAGLAGWVRLIIWLALIAVWALVSVLLLGPARPGRAGGPVS